MFNKLLKKLNSYPAVVTTIVALVFAAVIINPVHFFGEEVVVPVAERTGIPAAVGLDNQLCKSGWTDISVNTDHERALSCERWQDTDNDGTKEQWIVVLMPDRSFSHGFVFGGSNFINVAEEIPGWIK